MKRNLLVSVFIFFFSGAALAGYVDSDQKKADEKRDALRKQYVAKCKAAKIKHTCEEKAWNKAYYEVPPVRASDSYMNKHYGSLTKGQAIAELKKLVALYPQVKDDARNPDDWPGKVSPDDLNHEANFIMNKYFADRITASGITSARILIKQVGNRY